MNNPPADDIDRWVLRRKPSLDAEVLRQVERLPDEALPALKYAGVVFVNLEDVALNRVGPNSVLLEIGTQEIVAMYERAAELQMAVLTFFYGLFRELGALDVCDLTSGLGCELDTACCMKYVWNANRSDLLASISGYVIRSNLAEAALAGIVETHVLDLFDRNRVRCADLWSLRDLPR
jgi:hypothetical protein